MRLLLILLATLTLSAKVVVLDKINLSRFDFDGFSFSELSDLAYDSNREILYMVSDKGAIFSFRATFDNKMHLEPLNAFYLKRKNGKRLKVWQRDSEGLVLVNGKLYVSFEGKPKILQIDSKGRKKRAIKLPKALKRAKLRSRNKGLEALAYHKRYGFLTALEYAQKGRAKCNQEIFSTSGKKWNIWLEPYKNCAITALEVKDKDTILLLERAYSGIFSPFVVTLKEYNLKSKKSKIIFQLNSTNGDEMANYEGLTKVAKDRYLIVSDDNNNPFAKSELLYIKIVP